MKQLGQFKREIQTLALRPNGRGILPLKRDLAFIIRSFLNESPRYNCLVLRFLAHRVVLCILYAKLGSADQTTTWRSPTGCDLKILIICWWSASVRGSTGNCVSDRLADTLKRRIEDLLQLEFCGLASWSHDMNLNVSFNYDESQSDECIVVSFYHQLIVGLLPCMVRWNGILPHFYAILIFQMWLEFKYNNREPVELSDMVCLRAHM